MSTLVKTSIYVAAAAILAVIAALSSPGAVEPSFFEDTGEPFFPQLAQPDQAASLEIWSFDKETGEVVPFAVKKAAGMWQIPSHYDYPADAKDRMAKAAGVFVGLTKASVRSDSNEDHAKFGVVDPLDQSLEVEGRGMRVTFKDQSGAVLADLIVGKEVEGRTGTRYVRLADKKRTYTAKLPGELSTKFEDWIDRGLLDVGSYDIGKVIFDNYSVDEARGVVVPGEKVTMVKKDYDWTLDGLGEDEEIDKEKANEAVTTLTGLQIVDVRRKPEGLTARLERAQGISRDILMEHLARRGFFLANGKLYSNEGDLFVHSNKGVVYTLKFGEILYGSGDPTEASNAKDPEAAGSGEKAEDGDQGEKQDEARRYLMITAEFDEALLERPAGTPLSKEHIEQRRKAREAVEKLADAVRSYRTVQGKLPAALADLTAGESPKVTSLEKDPWGEDYVLVVKPAAESAPKPEGEATPEGEAKPEGEAAQPEFAVVSRGADKAEGGEGEAQDIASDQLDRETELKKVFDDHEAYAKKVEEGKAAATKLTDRFGPWYYVIDADSFGKLHLSRSDLAKPKTTEEKTEDGAAAEAPGEGKEAGK